MPREVAYLIAIEHWCVKLLEYTHDMTEEELLHDWLKQIAVAKMMELIGESARKLPDDLKAKHPEIPWKGMVGMRNILAHLYYEADFEKVWEAVTVHMPRVLEVVRLYIPPEPTDPL
ncbi:MAG: HepT-like ribonuclease domain-containing protein [bacterium]